MAADNGQQPEHEPQQVSPADLPFSAQVKPTGYKVLVDPRTATIRVRYTFTVGVVDVILEPGKELDAMIDDMRAANTRARTGLVTPRGIVGS